MSEIQIGTEGRFGILRQTGYDVPQTIDQNFHYYAFTGCDFGAIQMEGQLPQEAGGKSLPRGIFKSGVHAAGGVDLIPRMENRFGWLLEAACGDASSYTDQSIAQVIAGVGATPNVNTHLFGFHDTYGEFYLPYLTTHRYLPHDQAADRVGEIFQDCRVAGMTLTVNAAAIATARMDMLGRCSSATVWDLAPGWQMPTYDTDDTFLVTACSGSVKLSITSGVPAALTSFDTLTATLVLVNNLLPPQQSRMVGSPHPKDYPVLGRSIGIQTVLYIDDYDVYMQTFGGAMNPVTDTGWSCDTLEGDVDVTLLSPALIGATSEYYTLRYLTDQGNVKWRARPIVLTPNQPVLLALTGIIANPASGRAFKIYLQNATASYD